MEFFAMDMVLLGKSIEEIMDAAGERNVENNKASDASDERNYALSSSGVSSSLGSQHQNKSSISVQEMTKSRVMLQQQGKKDVTNGRSQYLPPTNLTKEALSILDEFKYGFPSGGLATFTNRWWGCNSPSRDDDVVGNDSEDISDEGQLKELADGGFNLKMDGTDRSKTASRGAGLLSTVRKRAVEQGQKALKLNAYQSYGIKRVDMRERTLLLQIFNSSLPTQWRNGSF